MKFIQINTVFLLIFNVFTTSCQSDFDKRLQQEALNFTANNCPQEPEPGTRLDSLTYHPKTRIYTLHYSVSKNNETILREQTPLLHHILRKRLIDDVSYKDIKEHGVTFVYEYRSQQTGSIFYKTEIRKEEYLYK